MKLKMETLQTHKDQAEKLRNEIASGEEKEREQVAEMERLMTEIQVSHSAPLLLSSAAASSAGALL
jgi:hypothetical protein